MPAGAFDPHSILLYKLTGVGVSKPRKKAAYNVWGKTQAEMIERKVKERATERNLKAKDLANVRCQITKELFHALSTEKQKELEAQSVEDHINAMEEWKRAITSPPSSSPEDRQLCIERLPKFIQPILDLICDCTGWKASLLIGGPEPADGGQLKVLGVHSGTAPGPVPMNFGRSEREAYKEYILPVYSRFLKKAYTIQECRSRALSNESMGWRTLNVGEDGWTFKDRVDEATLDDNHVVPKQTASIDEHELPRPGKTSSQTPLLPERSRSTSDSHPSELPSIIHVPSTSPSSVSLVYSFGVVSSSQPLLFPEQGHSISDFHASELPSITCAPSTSPPSGSCAHCSGVVSSPPPIPYASTPTQPLSPIDAPAGLPAVSVPRVSSEQIQDTNQPPSPRTSPRTSLPPSASELPPLGLTTKRSRAIRDGDDDRCNVPRKRTRHADHSSLPDDSGPSQAVPQWLAQCFSMLDRDDWGENWKLLVLKWFALEQAFSDNCNNKPLSSASRPPAVGDWIKRARSHTWCPKNLNLKRYEQQFWRWWTILQPEWRKNGDQLLDINPELDWMPLRVFGKNGLVSVMASLYFWGCNIGPENDGWKAWRSAVSDVAQVIDVL